MRRRCIALCCPLRGRGPGRRHYFRDLRARVDLTRKIREATVKAYLFTIARNLYRDHLRRNNRLTELEESMPDPSVGLARRTEHKAELSAVLAALRQLSEVDRAALLMRVQEEMPYEEIAQALKLPVTTVKVKVHRARLKLMHAREIFQEVRP